MPRNVAERFWRRVLFDLTIGLIRTMKIWHSPMRKQNISSAIVTTDFAEAEHLQTTSVGPTGILSEALP